jgi:hypothetical protein
MESEISLDFLDRRSRHYHLRTRCLLSTSTHTRFLNQQEKDYLVEKLTEDRVINKDPGVDAFRCSEVRKAFTSPQVVLVGIIYFFLNGM